MADPASVAWVEPWNHNLHYQRVIVDAIPPGCERALDVGWGRRPYTS